jgi:hypothetical protein
VFTVCLGNSKIRRTSWSGGIESASRGGRVVRGQLGGVVEVDFFRRNGFAFGDLSGHR